MFSPAIRLNTQQNNENADSAAIARKPGQSQLLLRKAFQDCPNTPNIKSTIPNKRALTTIQKSTPKFHIKTDTPKAETSEKHEYPFWAYDWASNKLIDVAETTPEYAKINLKVATILSPKPTVINDFVFEVPKLPEIDYFEISQVDPIDLPDLDIPHPNFNDFAF